MPACTLLRAHSSRRTSSDPRPSHVLCGLMKAASHGAVHDAGQPHVDRTGCHARRPLGGITGAGRRGGSSAAGFRWPSLAFRSQIYYFRSSRESEARTCTALHADQPDGAGHFFRRHRGCLSNRVSRYGGSKQACDKKSSGTLLFGKAGFAGEVHARVSQ